MSDQSQPNFALDLLSKLCLNERLSDVRFICDDESIPAHKTILAASCPYFESLLLSEQNKDKNEFHLVTRAHLFRLVLKYIYTGNASVDALNDRDVIGLFTLCQELQFPRLSEAVSTRLNAIEVSIANVGLMFEAAKASTSVALVTKCWKFIDENAENIVENKEEFAKFNFDLIREIVGRESFKAPEIKIFEALAYWREKNENLEMPEVFSRLRLHLIKAEEYANIVRRTRLISDEDYFASFTNQINSQRRSDSDSDDSSSNDE